MSDLFDDDYPLDYYRRRLRRAIQMRDRMVEWNRPEGQRNWQQQIDRLENYIGNRTPAESVEADVGDRKEE